MTVTTCWKRRRRLSCRYLAARLLRVGLQAICSASVSYLFTYFKDFCQTNYLNIYGTDFLQMCTIDRTTAVDDQSEIKISTFQATLPRQSNVVGFGGLMSLDAGG